MLPGVLGQANQVGANIAATGSAEFTSLQNQINDALAQLPEFQAGAQQAQGLASQYATQAFSPVANEDLYQTALRRAESAARPGQAAAGTLGTGAGDQAMQDVASNLAFQFGGLQDQQRQAAIQQLTGTSTAGASLAGLGPQIAQGGLAAVPQLAQALAGQYGIPLEAAGSILQMIMSGVGPATQLTAATAPVPLSSSHYFSI